MVVDLRAGCTGEDDAGDPLAAHDERLAVLAREFDQDVPVVVVLDGGGQGGGVGHPVFVVLLSRGGNASGRSGLMYGILAGGGGVQGFTADAMCGHAPGSRLSA